MGTSVETGSVSPGVALVGAAVMTGRAAAVPSGFSRYGGVKICPSRWLTLRQGSACVSEEPQEQGNNNSLLRVQVCAASLAQRPTDRSDLIPACRHGPNGSIALER